MLIKKSSKQHKAVDQRLTTNACFCLVGFAFLFLCLRALIWFLWIGGHAEAGGRTPSAKHAKLRGLTSRVVLPGKSLIPVSQPFAWRLEGRPTPRSTPGLRQAKRRREAFPHSDHSDLTPFPTHPRPSCSRGPEISRDREEREAGVGDFHPLPTAQTSPETQP